MHTDWRKLWAVLWAPEERLLTITIALALLAALAALGEDLWRFLSP